MAQTVCVLLDASNAAWLVAIACNRFLPFKHTQRARIFLLSAERLSVQDGARACGVGSGANARLASEVCCAIRDVRPARRPIPPKQWPRSGR